MAASLGTHFADMFLTFYNSNTNLIYKFDLADNVVTGSSPMGGGVDQIDIAYDTVTETVSSTVPEPSSVMLALAALVALAVAARKPASRTRGT
jgi:PEP-CTERM motif